mmetsp:Transcript_8203/g.17810  ORF Transcript_8203/g.17810 Transcript_8203/m.17810 type:complete len:83 (+) Transcript_8203:745-993(+)
MSIWMTTFAGPALGAREPVCRAEEVLQLACFLWLSPKKRKDEGQFRMGRIIREVTTIGETTIQRAWQAGFEECSGGVHESLA